MPKISRSGALWVVSATLALPVPVTVPVAVFIASTVAPVAGPDHSPSHIHVGCAVAHAPQVIVTVGLAASATTPYQISMLCRPDARVTTVQLAAPPLTLVIGSISADPINTRTSFLSGVIARSV